MVIKAQISNIIRGETSPVFWEPRLWWNQAWRLTTSCSRVYQSPHDTCCLHAFEEDSTVIEVTGNFICLHVVQSIPLVAAYSFPHLMTYVSFVTPLVSRTLQPPIQAIKILTSKACSRCGIYEMLGSSQRRQWWQYLPYIIMRGGCCILKMLCYLCLWLEWEKKMELCGSDDQTYRRLSMMPDWYWMA